MGAFFSDCGVHPSPGVPHRGLPSLESRWPLTTFVGLYQERLAGSLPHSPGLFKSEERRKLLSFVSMLEWVTMVERVGKIRKDVEGLSLLVTRSDSTLSDH